MPGSNVTPFLLQAKATRKPSTAAGVARFARARAVMIELRGISGLQRAPKFASTAHRTLPLYFHILRETETAKAADPLCKGRTFTLLPTKAGFTISNAPISNMALMGILKEMKLERFTGDGRHADHRRLWAKYFNVNYVETRSRRFDNFILTDGCSVSALLINQTALCSAGPQYDDSIVDAGVLRLLRRELPVDVKGLDPGFDDLFTSARLDGHIESYSSARYYDKAKIFLSQRRTNRWNAETADLVASIPTDETASLWTFKLHAAAYLLCAPKLFRHRAAKGYRNMRFLRFTSKQKALEEICDLIAPPDRVTVLGFGDWNGGAGTPIKRRCAGPLQELKRKLGGRPNVYLRMIGEFRTSRNCYNCHCMLTKMKAATTRAKRGGRSSRTTRVGRVHKVLHCRSSQGGQDRCGTTWNRDVNAAKNMLMLLMCEIRGFKRPEAFCRPIKPAT